MERLSESSEGRRAREYTATKSTLGSGEVAGDICNDTLEKLKEKEDEVGFIPFCTIFWASCSAFRRVWIPKVWL